MKKILFFLLFLPFLSTAQTFSYTPSKGYISFNEIAKRDSFYFYGSWKDFVKNRFFVDPTGLSGDGYAIQFNAANNGFDIVRGWRKVANEIYYSGGFVGINTSTPSEYLAVNGNIRLQGTGQLKDHTGTPGTSGMVWTSQGPGLPNVWADPAGSIPGGVTGRVLYYTGASTLGNSANFIWDGPNNRLGINMTPTQALSVAGNAEFIGGGTRTLTMSRSGGSTLQATASASSALFGTITNHPLTIITNNVTRMTFGTDGGVSLPFTTCQGPNNNDATYTLRLIDNVGTQRAYFASSGRVMLGIGSVIDTCWLAVNPTGTNLLASITSTGVVNALGFRINNSLAAAKKYLRGNGSAFVEADLRPSDLVAEGATANNVLQYNGTTWVSDKVQPNNLANISGSGTEGFQPYWTGSTWIYSDKRQSAYTIVTGSGTVSASSNRRNTVFNPGSTQASMTVRLHPAGTPVEGQEVALTFVYEIIALTVTSNGAAAVLGAPNTVAAGRTLNFKYYATVGTNGTWILQQ